MGRFEEDPPRRPGAPPRPSQQPDFDDGLGERLAQADRVAERVRSVGERRLLPQISMRWLIPKFIRRRLPKLPPEAQHRLQLVSGLAQTIGIIVLGALGLALLFQTLTRQALIEPKTAEEVFERVKDPTDLSYSVETIRVKRIDGSLLRQDTIRGVQVKPQDGKFRVSVQGVSDRSFRMAGDGKTSLLQYDGRPAQVLSAKPTEDELRPVYGSDLKPVATRIINDKATVAGQRGWFLEWKPTPQLITRLLSADLLRLDNDDLRAIKANRFKVRYATATVVRSTQRLFQIDTVILVNDAQLRILATYRQQNSGRLDTFTLDPDPEQETVN